MLKTLIQPNSQDKHIISLNTHHPFLLVDRIAVFSGLAIVHGVICRPVGAGEQVCMDLWCIELHLEGFARSFFVFPCKCTNC